MFATTQGWDGTRRRKAVLLIVAWFAFTASQVFAACCKPVSGVSDMSRPTASVPHHGQVAVSDECGHTLDQARHIVVEAAPAAARPGVPFTTAQFQLVSVPIVPGMARTAAFAVMDGPARVPIQPSAAPIYLRFQRLLT